jgi:hypothetical protein
MRIILLAPTIVLLVVGGCTSVNKNISTTSTPSGAKVIGQSLKRHSFEVGPEVYYFNYQEKRPLVIFGRYFDQDETIMEEEGIFYGVTGAYIFREWVSGSGEQVSLDGKGLMLRAEGRFALGTVDYDGQTQGGEPLTISDIDDRTMELRPLIGFSSMSKTGEGFLYTGFGYRYLNDDLSKFYGGYERESNYYYIPIGITGTGPENADGWTTGLTFEFDFLLKGLQKSHLSDTGFGFSDFENKQKNGWGLRASMKFIKRGKIEFEPFARFWAIEDSEIEIIEDGIAVYEPKNETLEAGVNIMMRF